MQWLAVDVFCQLDQCLGMSPVCRIHPNALGDAVSLLRFCEIITAGSAESSQTFLGCLETICWYVFLGCCPKHRNIWRYFFNLFSSALLFIVYSAFIYIYWWMNLYSTLALDSLPACSTFPMPFFYLFLFQTFFPDLDTFVSSPDKAVK